MEKKSFIWLILGLICVVGFCFGCIQKPEEKKVVARINNYVMTLEDLEDEIKYSPYTGNRTEDLEELLDLAIRRQVLIQEAQRQGVDKHKSFTKTIGRYWRQTLIKELLEKESQRIYKNISKRKQKEALKALKAWKDELYKKANVEIYREILINIK